MTRPLNHDSSSEEMASAEEVTSAAELHLGHFEAAPDDHGLSLDELSQTFAELIGKGDDPYLAPSQRDPEAGVEDARVDAPDGDLDSFDETAAPEEGSCEISPHSILEAMLFVGNPDNTPLSSTQVAALMRGVRPEEIHELVAELNEAYEKQGCCFKIKSTAGGYQMALRDRFHSLRDKFYGKIREARLSQAAIDVLAIVAYNQPITREEVERLRGKPSGGLLRQLLRREILRMERTESIPRITRYFSTDRFLKLFGMEHVEELPQSQELDRGF